MKISKFVEEKENIEESGKENGEEIGEIIVEKKILTQEEKDLLLV